MTPAWWAMLQSFRAPCVFNPWGESDPTMDLYINNWELRVRRLTAHLECKARYLLVGEAPGYQGCRWSGVPFTSERLMVQGHIPRVPPLGAAINNLWRITQRQTSWAEPSATIVWKALRELGIHEQTVLWNAFPWHPHCSSEPLSNRTPTDTEMMQSHADVILCKLIENFPSAVIISVGKLAERTIPIVTSRRVHRVRHPANGGATKFREQLGAIVNGCA
jgi:uracil-DNA glycosylase